MKTFIVPTDFSPVSLNAVNFALDLAVHQQGKLVLLNVCSFIPGLTEIPYKLEKVTGSIERAEKNMFELRENLLHKLDKKIPVETKVVTGTVIDGIKEACAKEDPFAVIMGIRGSGELKRLIFGSNALSAMKLLPWPVIIVPPGARYTSFHKIGFVCDLKDVRETVPAARILELIKIFGASLQILHISTENRRDPAVIDGSINLQKMLADANPEYHFIENAEYSDNLNTYAENNNLDLLIILPQKHGLFERVFQRSFTKELALHTQLPLLSIPRPEVLADKARVSVRGASKLNS